METIVKIILVALVGALIYYFYLRPKEDKEPKEDKDCEIKVDVTGGKGVPPFLYKNVPFLFESETNSFLFDAKFKDVDMPPSVIINYFVQNKFILLNTFFKNNEVRNSNIISHIFDVKTKNFSYYTHNIIEKLDTDNGEKVTSFSINLNPDKILILTTHLNLIFVTDEIKPLEVSSEEPANEEEEISSLLENISGKYTEKCPSSSE